MIKSFGKPCLSSDPGRKWRLQILDQIFRRAGDFRSVMQAVCDWAQIKSLDSKGLGELPSWQYCQLPHHEWKEETPYMTPWGEDAQKHDTWTSPRPCPCVSTLFWFCFVSFCSNKMVTIGYSAFMRSVSHSSKLLKLRSWWEPRNLQLVSCGGLCLSRVKFGLT